MLKLNLKLSVLSVDFFVIGEGHKEKVKGPTPLGMDPELLLLLPLESSCITYNHLFKHWLHQKSSLFSDSKKYQIC